MKKIAFYATSIALVLAPVTAIAQETSTTGQPQSAQPESSTAPVMMDYSNNGGNQNTGNGHDYSGGGTSSPAFGNWQQAQPFSFELATQANRGGISASGFDAEEGEAGSSTTGMTYSAVGATFDSCAGCEGNSVYGEVASIQQDEGYAFGVSGTSGRAAIAESVGSAATTVTGSINFNGSCTVNCQGNTSAGQPSSNAGNSDH